MRRSGSIRPIPERTTESRPLYMDNIRISAAVPIAIPAALMAEITFITLCDLRAKR